MRRRIQPLAIAALVVGSASLAEAQRCGGDFKLVRDAMPVNGLRIGVPQVVSFYTGPTYFSEGRRCTAYLQYVIDIGVGAGEAGLAYGYGRRGSDEGPPTVLRLQGSVLRSWGPSWPAPSQRWFAGGSVQVARSLGVRVGLYRQLDGPERSRRLVTASLVIGM